MGIKKLKKKLKKLKLKNLLLKDDLEYLEDRVSTLESRNSRISINKMKLFRIVLTTSAILFTAASIYSVFFK